MKRIVVYSSETGFTEKYANWIGKALDCETKALSKTSQEELKEYEQVIYGGKIMGSMIKGYDAVSQMNLPNLVLFAVGFSERTEETRKNIIEVNKIENTPFFYFKGGVCYEKMNLLLRIMIKKITKQKTSVDLCNEADIEELVAAVQ